MGYGKWIAGGLGFWFGGPIGAIVGFALGSIFDGGTVLTANQTQNPQEGFRVSLIVLVAAVMKADGEVKKSELDYVKDFFVRNFGVEATKDAMLLLRDILKKDIPIDEVGQQIGQNLDYNTRLQLLHFLYGIGKADGVLDSAELTLIERIAYAMGITGADMSSTKGMYFEDINSAYAVLEVSPESSDDEVKKAYRSAAIKYHPDKVAHLGTDVQKSATERFRQVNEAYDKIKKARGMA
jgi:DnaJ like chaperone protein